MYINLKGNLFFLRKECAAAKHNSCNLKEKISTFILHHLHSNWKKKVLIIIYKNYIYFYFNGIIFFVRTIYSLFIRYVNTFNIYNSNCKMVLEVNCQWKNLIFLI